MLPSSRKITKNNIGKDAPISLGAIERFYKKSQTTIGATDARDKSKINHGYSTTNLDKNTRMATKIAAKMATKMD